MMKIRDKLLKQFKVSNSITTLKAYKQFRNCVVNEIKESKKHYFQPYFHENKKNTKMFRCIYENVWYALERYQGYN